MRLHRPQTLGLALLLLGVLFKLNKPRMLSLPAYSFRQGRMAPQRAQALPPIMQGIGAAPAQPTPAPQQAFTSQPQPEQNSRGPWLEVVHIGDSAPKAKPRPQQSQPAGRADDSRPIGKNSRGQQVFEDKNGVRSYADGGVRVSQSVGVIPGHGNIAGWPELPRKYPLLAFHKRAGTFDHAPM